MDAASKEILRQVFGDSSDSDDLEPGDGSDSDPTHFWEPIKQIKGLWLCRDFLSPQHQSSLLSTIQNGAFSFSTRSLISHFSINLFASFCHKQPCTGKCLAMNYKGKKDQVVFPTQKNISFSCPVSSIQLFSIESL